MEQLVIEELYCWYVELNEAELFGLHHYLLTGDPRIVLALRESSERLKRFDYMSFTDSPDESLPERIIGNRRDDIFAWLLGQPIEVIKRLFKRPSDK